MDAVYTVRLKDNEIDLFEDIFARFASRDPRLTKSAFIRHCVKTVCEKEKDFEKMLDDMAEVYDVPSQEE